ncbi:Alpha/Beta hydrolase protein [Lipomyces kononenkoae]|uniref:Alpha/Beta hydrolase protein n=1 Tax=Lipomyces kononenkoae TaxID=34357 RepID=A0ACC3SYK6_LIPKO
MIEDAIRANTIGRRFDFVTALDLPPAVIIGNSVGGFAAASLAISNPSRVRALVLVNSGGFALWNPVNRLLCSLLGFPTVARFIMPRLVRWYMDPQTAEDKTICRKYAARARTKEGSWVNASLWKSFLKPGHDLRPRANEIRAPTLLVLGVHDIIIPLDVGGGQTAHTLIPGSKLELFETGHVVVSSKPDEFVCVFQEFMQSTSKGPEE